MSYEGINLVTWFTLKKYGVKAKGLDVGHILADGSVIMHHQLEQEIVGRYCSINSQIGLCGINQYRSLLEEAYRRANFEIGYRMSGNKGLK